MDKQQKNILAIVGILLAVSVIATVAVFFVTRDKSDFTPPPFDETAKKGIPTVEDQSALYQKVAHEDFAFSLCWSPLLEDTSAKVYFSSEHTNSVYLLIKLYDAEGNEIGQSGLVRPGEYVENISITDLPDTDETISAKVFSYEPKTYYSAGTVSLELSLRAVQ